MSALHVCWLGLNDLTVCGARFDCLIIPKKPKVRVTCMAGPSSPKLGFNVQSLMSKSGLIGKRCRGGLFIVFPP